MVDVNYAISVNGAIAAARALEPYDIVWFKNPIIPNNYNKGYGQIDEETGKPLSDGKKICTSFMSSNSLSVILN